MLETGFAAFRKLIRRGARTVSQITRGSQFLEILWMFFSFLGRYFIS